MHHAGEGEGEALWSGLRVESRDRIRGDVQVGGGTARTRRQLSFIVQEQPGRHAWLGVMSSAVHRLCANLVLDILGLDLHWSRRTR